MKHLSEAQLKVMLAIWEAKEPVSRSEIQERLHGSQWQITTLNTFLNRLSQSGFLKIDHRGKEYVYSALVSEEEYKGFAGKNILKTLYGNSIKKFVASVCNSNNLTEEEVDSLQTLLAKLKEGDQRD